MNIKNTTSYKMVCIIMLLCLFFGILLAFNFDAVFHKLSLKQKLNCDFLDILHLYCPSCGATRGMSALLEGRILTSIKCNPIPLYMLICFAYFSFDLIRIYLTKQDTKWLPYTWMLILFIAILVWTLVIRNLLVVFCGIDYLKDIINYWH